MSRKEGQKLKLLTLIDIFVRETDEKHPLSVPRLVEMLRQRGIEAERKSIYADIETLKNLPDSPFDIIQRRGRGGGYYMADTPFELAELKLLVDAVYTSKFITARKSNTLIEKLGNFTSRWQQEELDRQVQVSGRIKSQDEKILYTVDALHAAITAGVQVKFKYCDWTLEKEDEAPPRRPVLPGQPLDAGVGERQLLPDRLHRGRAAPLPGGQDAERRGAARPPPRRQRGV